MRLTLHPVDGIVVYFKAIFLHKNVSEKVVAQFIATGANNSLLLNQTGIASFERERSPDCSSRSQLARNL